MPPHPDNVRRRGGRDSPTNVEWLGANPSNNRDDRKIGRDPDEWSPPPKPKEKKYKKSHTGGGGGKSRDYEKPWIPKVQKDKKKKGGKKGDGDDSPFLLHHYPDGQGPDAELIRMLERDMLDKNPNVTFDDIASLDSAK